jgi:hypothetical protein
MSLADAYVERYAARPTARLLILAAAFLAIFAASWPIVVSFDLWVLKDRGSFLNLDYLVDQHLRIGVDAYYSYGLLPVLVQRVLFAAFGRGYWPIVGCTVATLLLNAVLWARVAAHLPDRKVGLVAGVALSPILICVNYNLPYAFVDLTIMFALLFVLERRLDLAMAVSALGWLSVPSLPLVLTGLLFVLIVAEWWLGGERSPAVLARRLGPGIGTFVVAVALLGAVFGTRSVLATVLPISGAAHYRSVHYGLGQLFVFLHPGGHRLTYYYLSDRAGWWITSTLALFVLSIWAARDIVRERSLDPRKTVILLCGIVQAVFIFVAYGSASAHVIYDPVLALGVLLGLCCLPLKTVEGPLLAAFLGLAVLGDWAQVRQTVSAWRQTQPASETLGLYAAPAWTREWVDVLARSATQRLLLLSYATGAHHYFPTVETADSWFLQPGQMLPADETRLLAKVRRADVIVQDLTSPTAYVDDDADIQKELASRCMTKATASFRIWTRGPIGVNGEALTASGNCAEHRER